MGFAEAIFPFYGKALPKIAVSSDECRAESWRHGKGKREGECRWGRSGKLGEEGEGQNKTEKKETETDFKAQRNCLSP